MIELLRLTFTQILASYSQYSGSGMYLMFLFFSLIYIYIADKKTAEKSLLLYYPIFILAVIFNPFIAYVIIRVIGDNTYWRMFWILPTSVVIAYTATRIICYSAEKYKRIVVLITLVAILIAGGRFIFTNQNFTTSSNWFKLPPQTIQVCEIIKQDCDGKIRVVVPADLEVSIRQYDADIQMPYGRSGSDNTGVTAESVKNFYSLMQGNVLDVDTVSSYMRAFVCNYIVLYKTTTPSYSMEVYGFQLVASTESYDIYRFPVDGMDVDE
jgi:hypothetical protein